MTAVCENPKCQSVFDLTRKDKRFCTRKCKESFGKRHGTKYSSWRTAWQREQRQSGYAVGRPRYKEYKGTTCEMCGFVPEHKCQLDVDHIDGNHSNDDPTNLQTLCANCHRLKTYKQRWS